MAGKTPKAERAMQYRLRAEELLTVAQEMTHKESRDMLVRTAEDYLQMASALETMADGTVPDEAVSRRRGEGG